MAVAHRTRVIVMVALSGYACGGALAWAADFHMFVEIEPFVHFLDARALRSRLWESLLYLHAQPPLLNFILGAALKLEQAGGPSIRESLFWMQQALGALAAAGVGALAARMIRSTAAACLATLVFVLHPMLHAHATVFFYTIHELLFLVWMAVFVERYLRRRRAADFAGAGVFAVALVHTHALFSPLWAAAALAGLYGLDPRRRPGNAPRRMVPVALCLAAVLCAWPLKNWIIFDSFSYTSWLGYNLAHNYFSNSEHILPDARGLYRPEQLGAESVRWTLGHAEFDLVPLAPRLQFEYTVAHPAGGAAQPVRVTMRVDGKPVLEDSITSRGPQRRQLAVRALNRRQRVEFDVAPTWRDEIGRELGIAIGPMRWLTTTGSLEARILMPPEITRGVPAKLRHVPALVKPLKPGNHTNCNHYWMFDFSRRGLDLTVRALRRNPRLLLDKIAANYLFYTRFSGRHPNSGDLGCPPGSLLWHWKKIYEIALCQDFRPDSKLSETGMSGWPVSGFMLTFPALIALIAAQIARRWRAGPVRARTALFMLYCIVWVFLLSVVVDGLEGNRLRFATLPFLIILACGLPAATARRRPLTPSA